MISLVLLASLGASVAAAGGLAAFLRARRGGGPDGSGAPRSVASIPADLSNAELAAALQAYCVRVAPDLGPLLARPVLQLGKRLAGVLAQLDDNEVDPHTRFDLRQAAERYLPDTLEPVLRMPKPERDRLTGGGSVSELKALIAQVKLIDDAVARAADALAKHDLRELDANGRFLRERLGGPSSEEKLLP